MHVLLSRHPKAHPAYSTIVAAPPDDVQYSWNDGGARPGGSFRGVARAAARAVQLPHVRPMRRRPGIDVVHSCQELILSSNRWVVDVEHGSPFVGTEFDRLKRPSVRRLIRLMLERRNCAAILAWTETAARGLRSWFGDRPELLGKIHVVSPAVLPTRHGAVSRTRDRLLFVANSPEWNFVLKGGRELLEAARLIAATGRSVSVWVVGPVPSPIVQQWASHPCVKFWGRIDRHELDRLYDESDVFVMPSFSDTFGMVYLEAMAHGLPVIALDRPFTRDVVRDGQTGALVPLGPQSMRWVDENGRFTMNSGEFIECMMAAPVDEAVVAALQRQITRFLDDAALTARLSANARAETVTGRFSIAHRNRLLTAAYQKASNA